MGFLKAAISFVVKNKNVIKLVVQAGSFIYGLFKKKVRKKPNKTCKKKPKKVKLKEPLKASVRKKKKPLKKKRG
jgi:hypothetical protein